MQIYDQMYAYINGKLLAENTSIGTELTGNQQEVDTLVRGFAGISPGRPASPCPRPVRSPSEA